MGQIGLGAPVGKHPEQQVVVLVRPRPVPRLRQVREGVVGEGRAGGGAGDDDDGGFMTVN